MRTCWRAYQQVVGNQGAPGVDGITVDELKPLLQARWEAIRKELLDGTYRPSPVRKVEIPKPGGRRENAGHSDGCRSTDSTGPVSSPARLVLTRRSQTQASAFVWDAVPTTRLERAREHVAAGYRWVVDMDLEKFFDRVNHDILMSRLARRIEDKRILRLIRRYLQAGMMEDGLVSARTEGTPQGGPLTPPTKVQNSVLASFADKKGEVDAIGNANLVLFDPDSFDQGSDDLATGHPVGLVQAVVNLLGELVQTG